MNTNKLVGIVAVIALLAVGGLAATVIFKKKEPEEAPAPQAPIVVHEQPAVSKPVVAKVEVPAGAAVSRTITDVPLPAATNAADIVARDPIELHAPLDEEGEPALAWHGTGKATPIGSFEPFIKELKKHPDSSLLMVADARVPWVWVHWVAQAGREARFRNVFVGAARPEAPTQLRGFEIPLSPGAEPPMPPADDRFVIEVKVAPETGAPQVLVQGKESAPAAFPADVAAAWQEWSAASEARADTSSLPATRVVLIIPKNAYVGGMVQVLDAMRGAGIVHSRMQGAMPFPMRPR